MVGLMSLRVDGRCPDGKYRGCNYLNCERWDGNQCTRIRDLEEVLAPYDLTPGMYEITYDVDVPDLLHEIINTFRERMNPKPKGAWFVFGYDSGAFPAGLCGSEVEALRIVERNGWGHVVFWEFGKELSEVQP